MFLPKACLFDLDGLLLDTEPLHGEAWSKTSQHFGANLSQKELLNLRGRRRTECAKQIITWIDKSIEVKDFLSVHDPISKDLLSKAKPMPGAQSLIEWCSYNQLPMALVTSSSSASIALKSSPHKWLDLIKTRVLGDDPYLKQGKPAPDPFLLAAERLEVKPTSCWAFEDSKAGSEAALAAGCQVWILKDCKNNFTLESKSSGSDPIHIESLTVVLEKLKSVSS